MKTVYHPFGSLGKPLAASVLALAAAAAFAVHAHPVRADNRAASGTMHTPASRAAGARDYRASQLIGRPVEEQGVTLGALSDLVIDMDTGAARYAILSLDGDIGIGESRLYALPLASLSVNQKTGSLGTNVPAHKWQEQRFQADHWPDLRNSGFWSEVDRLSGSPAVQPAEGYYAHRVSELMGKRVNNVEGTSLGVLRDLVVDLNAGRIRYAVLESKIAGGKTGKLLAFPITAFEFREAKNGSLDTGKPLVLDKEPAGLQAMRGLDRNRWPGLTGRQNVAKRN